MITTTLAVIALAGGLSAGNIPSPNWQKDYAQALAVASSEGKPVAVFISQGNATPGKVVTEGPIPSDAAKLLRDKYVCVYLDTQTTSGKAMATQFALSEGLIISSPGGKYQALRHSGSVSGTDLTGTLTRYAGAGTPAATVSSGYSGDGVVVAAGGSASRSYGVVYPGSYAAPTYQAPAYQPAPAYYGNPYSYGPACTGFR